MNWKNTTERYSALSIGMHWLMLLLLAGVYAMINLHDIAPKGSELRADLKTWHYMLGLSVFLLVALRLVIRLFSGLPPRIAPELPHWQERFAKAMHIALYVFMIAMPLLGWLAVSAKGNAVPFFGLDLPLLLSANKSLAHNLKEIHETIGTVGYYLIGLHAVAALFHHYVMRDTTLTRMLPAR